MKNSTLPILNQKLLLNWVMMEFLDNRYDNMIVLISGLQLRGNKQPYLYCPKVSAINPLLPNYHPESCLLISEMGYWAFI